MITTNTRTLDGVERQAITLQVGQVRLDDATKGTLWAHDFVESGDPDYPHRKMTVEYSVAEAARLIVEVLGAEKSKPEKLVAVIHDQIRKYARTNIRALHFFRAEDGKVATRVDRIHRMNADELGKC